MELQVSIENWQQFIDHLLARDRRTHVDREMYEVEVALNLHGVPTRFSCSGHVDSLSTFPYVAIASKDLSVLVPDFLSIVGISLLSEQAIQAQGSLIAAHEELGQNVLQLLNGFYQTHEIDIPVRLVMQVTGLGQYRLVNQGSIVGLFDSRYIDEFTLFTSYLKEVF